MKGNITERRNSQNRVKCGLIVAEVINATMKIKTERTQMIVKTAANHLSIN